MPTKEKGGTYLYPWGVFGPPRSAKYDVISRTVGPGSLHRMCRQAFQSTGVLLSTRDAFRPFLSLSLARSTAGRGTDDGGSWALVIIPV